VGVGHADDQRRHARVVLRLVPGLQRWIIRPNEGLLALAISPMGISITNTQNAAIKGTEDILVNAGLSSEFNFR
jgi:hypothetical protein